MRTIGEIKADIDALEASPSMYGNEWKVPKRNGLYGEFVRSFGIPIDRLEAICAAEREERLLVLPCKVGDTVYVVTTRKIGWWQAGYDICKSVEEMKFDLWLLNDFGKTVFLTRAEAEAALKEAQK